MIEPVNLIVLDEPPHRARRAHNHLDLPSCDVLEDALLAYPGTALLVTHDRHLIRSVADAIIEVRNGRAVWHYGVDEAILAAPLLGPPGSALTDSQKRGGNARVKRRRASPRASAQQRQTTSRQKRQLAQLEREYEAANAEANDLLRRLGDPDIYNRPEEVKALANAHEAAAQQAAAFLTRWEAAVEAFE